MSFRKFLNLIAIFTSASAHTHTHTYIRRFVIFHFFSLLLLRFLSFIPQCLLFCIDFSRSSHRLHQSSFVMISSLIVSNGGVCGVHQMLCNSQTCTRCGAMLCKWFLLAQTILKICYFVVTFLQ